MKSQEIYMPCTLCSNTYLTLRIGVLNGQFGKFCANCIAGNSRSAHSGHANYLRARDREDNSKDLLQPWDRSGKPNREFIREYPEEAKTIFSPQELRQYE